MKAHFFAALLAAGISAVNLQDYDAHFNQFAQIAEEETSKKATSLAEGASYVATDAKTITDAACEQIQGGVVVRLNTPECQLVKKPSADTLIMGAV